MRKIVLLSLTFILGFVAQHNAQNKDEELITDYNRKNRIVDFSENARWYNDENPKFLFDQKGKIVILNFWKSTSLSASSTISILQRVSEKYQEVELYTIDIPDFEREKDEGNIVESILLNKINHNFVQIDSDSMMLNLKKITRYPTAIIIVDDVIVKQCVGIDQYSEIDSFIEGFLLETNDNIQFSTTRLPKKLIQDVRPKSIFNGPSAISSDGKSLLFISDSGNDRIVRLDEDGYVYDVIGSGFEGHVDGGFASARFNNPQGLAYDLKNKLLYVADKDNHTIRKINFSTKVVSTILGNGEIAQQLSSEVIGTSGRISYPTDLELRDGRLFITMSGFNQVWEMDLLSGKAIPMIGSGKNESVDGKNTEAACANPISLVFDNSGKLIILDRHSAKIRQWSVSGDVITMNALDTISQNPLLNPTAICVHGKEIIVADPYRNNLYQFIDGSFEAILPNNKSGWSDGKLEKASLNDPSDLVYLNGKYYVIERGNGLIRVLDLKKGKLETLELIELGALTRYEQAIIAGEKVFLEPIMIGDGTNTIKLTVDFGDEYEIVDFGRNDMYSEDSKGFNKLLSKNTSDLDVVFECLGNSNNRLLRMEMYATYRLKAKPEMLYYQSAFLVIPMEFEEGANNRHEIIYELSKNFLSQEK